MEIENKENIEKKEIEAGDPLTIDQEIKTIKALTKIFIDGTTQPTQEQTECEYLNIIDSDHACMIISKNQVANKILTRFFNGDNARVPLLDYNGNNTTGSNFGFDYIEKIINVFKAISIKDKYKAPYINILSGQDKPLIISNEYFTFLLAPRLESD
jgi:hypothetical protein